MGVIGDMMINGYYSIMSVYGWYNWTRKKNNEPEFPIATISTNDNKLGIVYFYCNNQFLLFSL